MQKFVEIMYLMFIATLLVAQISAYAVPTETTENKKVPHGHIFITKKAHNISIGEYHEIICEVRYVPKISDIFWIRGDKIESDIESLQKQNPPLYILTESKAMRTLVQSKYIIESATEEDVGKYSCIAFSEDNKHYVTSTEVNVQSGDVKAHKKPGPVITEFSKGILSEIGSNVTLFCQATDNAKITWLGAANEILQNNERYEINGGILKINSITWEDRGDHTCVAETSEGSDEQIAYLYPLIPNK